MVQERANGMMGQTSFKVNSDGDACLFTPSGVTFDWHYNDSNQEMCIDPVWNRKRADEHDWLTYMTSFTFDLQIPEDDTIQVAILYYEAAEAYCANLNCFPWSPSDLTPTTTPNGTSGSGYLYYIIEPGEIKDVILFPGLPAGTFQQVIPTSTVQGYVQTVSGLSSYFTYEVTYMPSY